MDTTHFYTYDGLPSEFTSCATWVEGNWDDAKQLESVENQLEKIALVFAEINGRSSDLPFGQQLFRSAMKNSWIIRVQNSPFGAPWTLGKLVYVPDITFSSPDRKSVV